MILSPPLLPLNCSKPLFQPSLSKTKPPSIHSLSLPLSRSSSAAAAMAVVSRLRVATAPLMRRLSLGNRAFGSSAAAQLQHYYYDDDENDADFYGSGKSRTAMEESEGSVSGRGVQWVIMGDPMANRHVYAEKLSQLLRVPHISMGTLVRQELHPHSSLYKQIANAVNQGKLVPEEVIFGLLSKRLEEGYYKGETGFILEGIPRTRIQAEILDEIVDIDLVLNFKCSEDCLLKKHVGLRGCSACQDMFAACSSKLQFNLHSRKDQIEPSIADPESTFERKLRAHAEQRKPLEDYYKKQRKLLEFKVAGGPGETWQGLLAALHLQHTNAVSSSQKLTA